MFKTLRSLGASLGALNLGEKPLLANVREDIDTEIISRLLNRGYSPNIADSLGRTPLMLAAGNGNPNTISVLLWHGANVSAKDSSGATALHYAANAQNSHFPTFFKKYHGNEKGGGHDVPKDADYVSCVTHLCSAKGCDINAANEAGETALMLAVGHPELLEVLLRYKPDLSRRNRNSETAPALADRHAFIVSARLLRTHADTANAKT